jgi:transposase
MSKYDKQFKLKLVKEYLKLGGLERMAKLYKISTSEIRKWALAYQAHGHSGLNSSYQAHSAYFKFQVLQYMAQHQISARPAAAHFKIGGMSSILQWQKLYNEGGITALEPKPKGRAPMSKKTDYTVLLSKPVSELSHEELLKRLEYLEVENAYLKKLEALAQQKILAKQNKSKSSRS